MAEEPVHQAAINFVVTTSALPTSAACATLSDVVAMAVLVPLQANGNVQR
jgi:hypothetical protein